MKVDPELMFECLIYLNAFYYPVFASPEFIMVIAKYQSIRETPNIEQDGAVCFARLIAEILKILVFYRWKEKRRKIVTTFALLMTMVSLATVIYTFGYQDPILKLEKVLCSITVMLTTTEIVFGILFFFPCFKKVDYY
ncbi:unnamed protein product [Ceutorhynchus assimilis]|uniref:Uncharacterized protein n=1 Tax=Ceutorhynchus assimilis TaxID=467358 RepID=A0A9N9QQB6_9CUCU|nr:unnamed protein product [Ceutorhynchus assimilis]